MRRVRGAAQWAQQGCGSREDVGHIGSREDTMLRLSRQLCDPHGYEQTKIAEEAFRPLSISSVTDRAGRAFTISERCIAFLHFAVLRGFSREGCHAGRALVVAPLAGAYPVLLRDLVVALLSGLGEVAITDWADARYVPVSHGAFGLAENISHIEQMIRTLGARRGRSAPFPHPYRRCGRSSGQSISCRPALEAALARLVPQERHRSGGRHLSWPGQAHLFA
jgi:hypothetical protein